MKTDFFSMATLGIAMMVFNVCALADDVKSDPKAEQDYQAWREAVNADPASPFADMSPREKAQWIEQHYQQGRRLGLDFIEKHPNDPRRWKIVDNFSADLPEFATDWSGTNEYGIATNILSDKKAAAAWKAKVKELKDAMAQAKDVPEEVRDNATEKEEIKPFEAAGEALEKDQKIDFDGLRKTIAQTLAKKPQKEVAFTMFTYYIMYADSAEPARVEELCRACVDCPNTNISGFAKARLNFIELAKKPLEIAYTAVDGREVDLQKLRGKVVLVDMWATWCGPCVAELPNVKKVFDQYHDKGFEIVGISLEMANLNPKDTPEEASAKLNRSKAGLLQFMKKRGMTWPQYFDGKGWENPFSKRYALSGIPSMFLLDQDGRIVTSNARGEVLEKEVKRLLKL